MRRTLVVVLLCVSAGAVTWATRLALQTFDFDNIRRQHPQPARPVGEYWVAPTEQEWIVTEIVRAIDGIASNSPDVDVKVTLIKPPDRAQVSNTAFDVTANGVSKRLPVVHHLWAPEMYVPLTETLLGSSSSTASTDVDLGARAALVDRRIDTLLEENRRISDVLQGDMRSASAHEAAALLIGVMQLREGSWLYADERPALSRMAAHLAVARALRGTDAPDPDGLLALAVLSQFAGLQREALATIDRFDARFSADTDRAWSRAMRLRITGDWRFYEPSQLTTLGERLEYARALREQLDENAMLTYMGTFEPAEVTDWQRMALSVFSTANVETGHRFAPDSVRLELSEASRAWHAFHEEPLNDAETLIAALNDHPDPTPVHRGAQGSRVDVIDWGSWAEFSQRQVVNALVLQLTHAGNLRGESGIDAKRREIGPPFSGLTLYPLVERWALDLYNETGITDYDRTITAAWPLAERTPELLTAAAWNYLLQPARGTGRASPFPIDRAWFEPGTPVGTAFDLAHRSLQPMCRWPASVEEAGRWSHERPFDSWAQWSFAWLPVTGKPTVRTVRKLMGPLLDYNIHALDLMFESLDLSKDDRMQLADKMCSLAGDRCDRVASLLLLDGHDDKAAAAYARWVATARDTVRVSNNVLWLVRYYRENGRGDDAHAIASFAGDTGSAVGLRTFGEQLEAEGRSADAETVYRKIMATYPDVTVPLGTFLLKRALITHDKALESSAFNLLRPIFPDGPQRPERTQLDAVPADGAVFATFGRRAASFGLRADDIIVAVDGWRTRSFRQLIEAMRFSLDDAVSFTVWRDNRYREIRTRIPGRLVGVEFRDYVPPVRPRS